jgi:ATP-dependent Lon protease
VLTPEEQQYAAFAGLRPLSSEAQPTATEGPGAAVEPSAGQATEAASKAQAAAPAESVAPTNEEANVGWSASHQSPVTAQLKEQHLVVPENAKGWSYRRLFADYLQGCSGIIIRDPYIRAFHQVRNLVEFLRMVNEITPIGDEVTVHLITGSDQETMEKQVENLGQVQDSFAGTSTPFTWEIDASPNFHARSISTDHGWKISLDRGLDFFQWFEFSPFNAAAVMQEARMVKGCEVSYIKTSA